LALTCGIPHELFWELSIPEVEAVIEQRVAEQRAQTLRAGLIAATILNVHRSKGQPLVQPHDFLPGQDQFLTPEEAMAFMDRWAKAQADPPPQVLVTPTGDEVARFGEGAA
jgi:hypothetical protein